MRSQRWTVGVDFGGTNIKIGLIDRRGRIGALRVLASRAAGRPRVFVERVSRAITELTDGAGIRTGALQGVGIGAPGVVDAARGVVRYCVNVPGWRDVPLGERLERRLGLPCVVDNDANLFMLGEWAFGAGARVQELVGLTLGTGVGGGIILSGRIYHGATGSAGEIGHMKVAPNGRRCGCGSVGCLEAHVGTSAILDAARAAIRDGARILRRLAQAEGRLTPLVVCQAAQAGDRAARRIWADVGTWLGIGVASVVNILNPERVVIGGGIANAWTWFAPAMGQTVRSRAMRAPARAVRILRARLGDRAGILGAAVAVWGDSSGRGVPAPAKARGGPVGRARPGDGKRRVGGASPPRRQFQAGRGGRGRQEHG